MTCYVSYEELGELIIKFEEKFKKLACNWSSDEVIEFMKAKKEMEFKKKAAA